MKHFFKEISLFVSLYSSYIGVAKNSGECSEIHVVIVPNRTKENRGKEDGTKCSHIHTHAFGMRS